MLAKIYYRITPIKELIIVLCVVLISFCYLKPEKLIIKADGKGYYEYLPAIFIYHDLSWQYLDTLNTPGYYKHSEYKNGAILGSGKNQHNKYYVGTAILMLPFFSTAHLFAEISDYDADGFSLPYQQAMWVSALFYLWLGLFFIRKMLILFKIRDGIIWLTQWLLVFATPLLHYVTFEPTFSHVYSFAVMSALLYYGFKFITTRSNGYLYILATLIALAFLVRPFNILILPALFVVFKRFSGITAFFRYILHKKRFALFIGLIIAFCVLGIQSILWYVQKGSFIIDTYIKEPFDFSSPYFFSILFSYKKGLFVYSPVLFIACLPGLYFAIRKKKYVAFTLISFTFFIFTYVLSSWWSWWYGMSYGQRSYIDLLALFALVIAFGLSQLKKRSLLILLPVLLATIPVTVVQCYQYKNYILHWDMMNKDSFWEVFLKTDEKYRGVLWQNPVKYPDSLIENQYNLKNQEIPLKSQTPLFLFNDIHTVISKDIRLIEFDVRIQDPVGESKVVLVLKDQDHKTLYWNGIFTYHQTRGLKDSVSAKFQFLMDNGSFQDAKTMALEIYSTEESIYLSNPSIRFIGDSLNPNQENYIHKMEKSSGTNPAKALQINELSLLFMKKIENDSAWKLSVEKKAAEQKTEYRIMLENDARYMANSMLK